MLSGRNLLKLLIIFSTVCCNYAWMNLETCDISCKGKQDFTLAQGRPGKSGPKGEPGRPGAPGSSCECGEDKSMQKELRMLVTAFKTYMKGNDWYRSPSGNYFKVFTDATTYISAREKCKKIGAKLASKGLRDGKRRRNIIDAVIKPSKASSVWIGLDDFQRRLEFVWSDGVKASNKHSYWFKGEPNNSDNDERCGHLWFRKNTWGVNDENCNKKMAYMCQYLD